MATQSPDLVHSQRQVPSVPFVGILAAFALTVLLAIIWLGVPAQDLRDLMTYLVVSSVASALIGFVAYRWSQSGRRSIRSKILLAYAVGVLIVVTNIFVTAQLMFLSSHDLGLLILLMIFGAVFSISFGAAVAGRMTRAVNQLSEGARRVSSGDLEARVEVATNDELADLARSFNHMVENVNESEDIRRRAEEARKELVAAVSHDLRTPLTAIQAMLEALSDGIVTDERTIRRYHETMRSQVTHLSSLINDLFELSQLDADPRPFELSVIDVTALVRTTTEGVAMSGRERDIDVVFTGEDQYFVLGEPIKLARVVMNLLDNAVRHSPDGASISVAVYKEGANIRVSVADQGSGITEEEISLLFDRFYRGEKSRSRDHGGAGLGLSIAKGIVEVHGGQLVAENNVDRGAMFSFAIPEYIPSFP